MIAFFSGTPGPFEILIVLAVILLLFGAKRLPELSRSLGRSLSEFKKGKEEGKQELEQADTHAANDEHDTQDDSK